MTKEDRDRAELRLAKSSKVSSDSQSARLKRDASTQSVLDNMARLKAMRLAREAAAPPVVATPKKARAKSAKKANEKSPALSDWLAGQQNGGRRT